MQANIPFLELIQMRLHEHKQNKSSPTENEPLTTTKTNCQKREHEHSRQQSEDAYRLVLTGRWVELNSLLEKETERYAPLATPR